jgi:hypothetical protein
MFDELRGFSLVEASSTEMRLRGWALKQVMMTACLAACLNACPMLTGFRIRAATSRLARVVQGPRKRRVRVAKPCFCAKLRATDHGPIAKTRMTIVPRAVPVPAPGYPIPRAASSICCSWSAAGGTTR